MIKAKKGFLLRRLGDEYMVVAIGEASRNFNGMIRMNETGAFYWKELEKRRHRGRSGRKDAGALPGRGCGYGTPGRTCVPAVRLDRAGP